MWMCCRCWCWWSGSLRKLPRTCAYTFRRHHARMHPSFTSSARFFFFFVFGVFIFICFGSACLCLSLSFASGDQSFTTQSAQQRRACVSAFETQCKVLCIDFCVQACVLGGLRSSECCTGVGGVRWSRMRTMKDASRKRGRREGPTLWEVGLIVWVQ